MQDNKFMVIRVGKHREKILAADYKPEKWPESHEIMSGAPLIPAELAAAVEIPATESVSGASGATGAAGTSDEPESADIDALKAKADELGIAYGSNIGAPTLAKRIADTEGEAE